MEKTIHDDVLGTLMYDAEWEVFKGAVTFGEKQVKISISFSSSPENISEAQKHRRERNTYRSLNENRLSRQPSSINVLIYTTMFGEKSER